MRFSIPANPDPVYMGMRLLLHQLGIPVRLGQPEADDLRITRGSLSTGEAGVSLEECVTSEGRSILEYEGHRSEWPFQMEGAGAGIRLRGRILSLPAEPLAWLCGVSTLRRFDLGFAQTYSWDALRAALLAGLRRLADACGRPLIRLWYYPDAATDVAVGFSTDVDYLLQWIVIQDLASRERRAWMAWPGVAKRLAWLWNRAIACRYLSEEYFCRFWGPAWLHRCLRRATWALPRRGYVSALRALSGRVPITVFVRPTAFQREETPDPPPCGTGREAYRPSRIPGVEMGLHFGATVGPDLWPSVDNPYGMNPCAEGIELQRKYLQEELGDEVKGSRLHNEWRFTPRVFERIEASGVEYDSTAFLGWVDHTAVRASPVGNCLPYFPVLHGSAGPRFARFVELPVSGYEHEQIPIERLETEGLPILVSQHPDSTGVNLPRRILAGDHAGRWYVTYGELATWWHARARIRLDESRGALSVSDTPGRWCLAVYPPREVDVRGHECVRSRRRGEELLCSYQSSQSLRAAQDGALRTAEVST